MALSSESRIRHVSNTPFSFPLALSTLTLILDCNFVAHGT